MLGEGETMNPIEKMSERDKFDSLMRLDDVLNVRLIKDLTEKILEQARTYNPPEVIPERRLRRFAAQFLDEKVDEAVKERSDWLKEQTSEYPSEFLEGVDLDKQRLKRTYLALHGGIDLSIWIIFMNRFYPEENSD